jgi:hypothetical protein
LGQIPVFNVSPPCKSYGRILSPNSIFPAKKALTTLLHYAEFLQKCQYVQRQHLPVPLNGVRIKLLILGFLS